MENYFIIPQNENDLEKSVRRNMQIAHNLRKELKVLEEANKDLLRNCDNGLILDTSEGINEKVLKEPEEEYLYYYSNLIKDFSNSNESTDGVKIVIKNLPSIENKNYQNIINRIKIEILKEIYELEELKVEETDLEFIKEVEKEQEYKKGIIDWIDYALTQGQKEMLEHGITLNNKLIFLKTTFGSIYVENDLYGNEEYFESFRELLISIENGTLKHVKQFEGNSKLKGVSEVKGFKTRILFERLSENIYIVLGAFIKKSDKAKDYINSLVNRIDFYRKAKPFIELELSNPNYLEENQLLRDSIMDGLNNKKLVKTYRKSGDC